MDSVADRLWGRKARFIYLLLATFIMLFTFLGARDIWTQEHRWADIVAGMFFRHDFFHPYLDNINYYDKPLLSYWLIVGFSYLTGELSTIALRLPSAFAGLLAVWSIYRLGTQLKDRNFGLLAGWILLTTYYFIFWSRTSSADMLNMAGSLFAVYWYFSKKNHPSFINYAVFFAVLAFTSLCKGLVGGIVAILAIFPDLVMNKEYKKHLNLHFFLAIIPAIFIYSLPFWASAHFGGEGYKQNGLYLVYRENILRYFQPFDHKDPIYTYFIFLPIYLLPWAIFFIPALFSVKSRWSSMRDTSKWMCWAVLILFLFFTLSGSRRNYYILPLIPYAILMTADWIHSETPKAYLKNIWAGRFALGFFLLLFVFVDILQSVYYVRFGSQAFVTTLKQKLPHSLSSSKLQYVMLDSESKLRFYLHLPAIKNYEVKGERTLQTTESLLKACPLLKNKNNERIYITRRDYVPLLEPFLKNHAKIETYAPQFKSILQFDKDMPVAFIPKHFA